MTTMELIEKHGIGANCLSDAYDLGVEQGRADAEEEHKAMCESCIHKVSAEDIEQIRADAIDDYTEWLRKHHSNFDEEYAEDIKSDYLAQIKEQTDDTSD